METQMLIAIIAAVASFIVALINCFVSIYIAHKNRKTSEELAKLNTLLVREADNSKKKSAALVECWRNFCDIITTISYIYEDTIIWRVDDTELPSDIQPVDINKIVKGLGELKHRILNYKDYYRKNEPLIGGNTFCVLEKNLEEVENTIPYPSDRQGEKDDGGEMFVFRVECFCRERRSELNQIGSALNREIREYLLPSDKEKAEADNG